jgi:hypothetical protein
MKMTFFTRSGDVQYGINGVHDTPAVLAAILNDRDAGVISERETNDLLSELASYLTGVVVGFTALMRVKEVKGGRS